MSSSPCCGRVSGARITLVADEWNRAAAADRPTVLDVARRPKPVFLKNTARSWSTRGTTVVALDTRDLVTAIALPVPTIVGDPTDAKHVVEATAAVVVVEATADD